MIYDAVIIGGGASGLFLGANLSQMGKKVLIIEHSEKCGRKLLITGKGRCNVTNDCSAEEVMKNIPRNPRFMYSALDKFSPEDTINFFENLGVKLKTERGNRVFPQSDQAGEILSALMDANRKAGTEIIHDNAQSLVIKDGKALGVKCSQGEFSGRNIIVATGGKSYPKTGSTGDGYKFARQAGHTVTEIHPSLCPLVAKNKSECASAMGLSLRNCGLSLFKKGTKKAVYTDLGEMLFTHYGFSGPMILSASAHIEDFDKNEYFITTDLKPGLSEKQLDARILRDFGDFPNRDFSNSLGKLLPAKIISLIVKRSGIPPEKKVNQISREERERLVKIIKNLEFDLAGTRPVDEAIITRGGVNVKEINPKSMESKITENLYFVGEVLDVDGYTGGFNLQIAFSTAYCCAEDILYKE